MIKHPFWTTVVFHGKIDSEQLLDQFFWPWKSFFPSTSMESSYPYETYEWHFLIHLLFKCAMGQVRRVQVPQLGCVAFVAGHLALRTGKDTLLTLCDWVMSVLGVFFFAQYWYVFFLQKERHLNDWMVERFAILAEIQKWYCNQLTFFSGFLCISY